MNKLIKTHFIFTLLFSLVIVACSKANKNKVSNNWTVSNYKSSYKQELSNGDTYHEETTITDQSLTTTSEMITGMSNQVEVMTGNVAENSFTIKKDGTWMWRRAYKYAIPYEGSARTSELSGRWELGKGGNGANSSKNSRLNLTVLKEDLKISNTSGTTNNTNVYTEGEYLMTYQILESTQRKLRLKLESHSLYPNDAWSLYEFNDEMTLKN